MFFNLSQTGHHASGMNKDYMDQSAVSRKKGSKIREYWFGKDAGNSVLHNRNAPISPGSTSMQWSNFHITNGIQVNKTAK